MTYRTLLKFAAIVLAAVLLVSVAAVVTAMAFSNQRVDPHLIEVLKTISVSSVGAFAAVITAARGAQRRG